MKAKEYFTKTNGFYPLSSFLDRFGDMEMDENDSGPFETKKLPCNMTDKEILAELRPEEVTLGYVAKALMQADSDEGYLFYVRDTEQVLWAVGARWVGGYWGVYASSVERPDDWVAGDRVFSRRFSGPSTPSTLSPSDTLASAIEAVKKAGYVVYKPM